MWEGQERRAEESSSSLLCSNSSTNSAQKEALAKQKPREEDRGSSRFLDSSGWTLGEDFATRLTTPTRQTKVEAGNGIEAARVRERDGEGTYQSFVDRGYDGVNGIDSSVCQVGMVWS